jgi:hypothetical protein
MYPTAPPESIKLIVKACGIHSRTPSFAQRAGYGPRVTRLAFRPLQFAGCERFVSAKHLVWLNPPLLIEELRRKEDGDAPSKCTMTPVGSHSEKTMWEGPK